MKTRNGRPRPRRRPTYTPRLPYPVHPYPAGAKACNQCPLPKSNRVHDLDHLPQTTPEQREAEARRLGEHED